MCLGFERLRSTAEAQVLGSCQELQARLDAAQGRVQQLEAEAAAEAAGRGEGGQAAGPAPSSEQPGPAAAAGEQAGEAGRQVDALDGRLQEALRQIAVLEAAVAAHAPGGGAGGQSDTRPASDTAAPSPLSGGAEVGGSDSWQAGEAGKQLAAARAQALQWQARVGSLQQEVAAARNARATAEAGALVGVCWRRGGGR